MKDSHRDYPIEEVVKQVNDRLATLNHLAYVHQKWTCRHCHARQTMEEANAFHRAGKCEECNQFTVIDKCNYVLIIPGGQR